MGTLTVDPGTGTGAVLARLHRPYEPSRVVAALLGLPQRAARRLVGQVVAGSEEAERLLASMPRILRSLAIATSDRPQRCRGEIRGPVLWSETMSARSATAGDPGLYVCATTTKAYDTDENRILKAALTSIERAGRDAGRHGVDPILDDALRQARHNEVRARHLLEHHTLSAVPLSRISGRALKRTRSGSRRATYQPAIAMLARAHDPLRASDLEGFASPATRREHDLFAGALAALDVRMQDVVPLVVTLGGLSAGPLRFDHLQGVTVAGALVTSSDQIPFALDQPR